MLEKIKRIRENIDQYIENKVEKEINKRLNNLDLLERMADSFEEEFAPEKEEEEEGGGVDTSLQPNIRSSSGNEKEASATVHRNKNLFGLSNSEENENRDGDLEGGPDESSDETSEVTTDEVATEARKSEEEPEIVEPSDKKYQTGKNLSTDALSVMALNQKYDEKGSGQPSYREIEKKCNIGSPRIVDAYNELEQSGWIEREEREPGGKRPINFKKKLEDPDEYVEADNF